MSFSFRPAKREQISLLIGLAGGTGSGKTYSAMRLAKGLASGKRFALIDTEAGRGKHYADEFEFDHGDLKPPFRPSAYADAIAAADAEGYPVIVVDSFSHEHAGEGGLLDWHEEEFARMGSRDAVKMTAWIKPKTAHKQMVNRLLQVRAHLILCFRAEEKIEIGKDADGKTVVRPKRSLTGLDGWIPVCEKNLPYELTVSFLLTADHPGLPKPIKLQEQHRAFFPLDKPISEETGRALGEWAAGGEPKEASAPVVDEGALMYAGQLGGKLVTLLELLEVDGAEELVENHRVKNDLATHTAWLENQLGRAQAKARDKESPGGPDGGTLIEPDVTGATVETGVDDVPVSSPGDEPDQSVFAKKAAAAQRRVAEREKAAT